MAFSPETYVLLNGKIKKLQGEVDKLESATKWLGVTTTPITDGSSVNPIVIDGVSKTAVSGDIVGYANSEFIFNGDVWQEFGGDSYITLCNTLISGDESTPRSGQPFSYYNYTYYSLMDGPVTLPEDFPEYPSEDKTFRFDLTRTLEDSSVVEHYDAYYTRYTLGPRTWDIICIGTGSKEDIIEYPDYIIMTLPGLEPNTKAYMLLTKNADDEVPPWAFLEINETTDLVIDSEPIEGSKNLVTSGGVYNSLKNSGQVLNAHTIMGHNNNSSESSSESTLTYNEKAYYKLGNYIAPIPFDAEGSYYLTSDGDIGEFDGYLVPGESKPFGRVDYICFGEAGESKEDIIDNPTILCEIAYVHNNYDPWFYMYLLTPNTVFAPWWLHMDSVLKSIDISDYPNSEEVGFVSSNGIYQFVMDNLPEDTPSTVFYKERLFGTGGLMDENQTYSWGSNTYYKVIPYSTYLGNGVLPETEFPEFTYDHTYKFQYNNSGELVNLNVYYEPDGEEEFFLLCGEGNEYEVTSNPTFIIHVYTTSFDSPKDFAVYDLYYDEYSAWLIPSWRVVELSEDESVTLDKVPKEDSRTFVESGGVYSAVDAIEKRGIATVGSKIVTTVNGLIRAETSIPDGAEGQLIKKFHAYRHLSQYCNGYDRPWGPGGGKNIITGTTDVEVDVSTGSSKTYEFDLAPGFWSFVIDVELSGSGNTAGELTITAAQLDPAGPSSVIESITFDSSFPTYEVTRVNVPGFEILASSHVVITISNSSTGFRKMTLNHPMLEKGSIAHAYEPYANPSNVIVQTNSISLNQDNSEGEVRYYSFGVAESNPLVWPPAEFEMETDAYGNGYLLVLSIKKRLNSWGPFYKVDGENVFYTDGLASKMIIPEGEYSLDAKCTIYEASHDQNNNDTFFICGDADDHPGRIYFYPAKEYASAEDFSSDLSSYNVEIAYRTKNRTRYTLTMSSMDLYPSPSYTAQYVGFIPIELVDGYNKFYLEYFSGSSLFNSEFTITYTPNLVKRINEFAQPRQGTIAIDHEQWVPSNNGASNIYSQIVTVNGDIKITANSKVDIQLTAAQIVSLISAGVTGMVIENNNGTLTAYAVGATTTAEMTVQCTVEETI